MKSAVEIAGVSVTIEKAPVLQGISMDLPEGKITGLLGPSGAGKTTLMRVIVGLQKPKSGTVRVLNLPAGAAKLRQIVGFVTQAPSVYADLTVQENLQYFGALVGVGEERVQEIIRLVRLEDHTGNLAVSLSGGERARVSLAAALLGRPKLLVLDEPTVGLDPLLRQELWTMFHDLARGGTTLLISSHVMDEAKRCDNLVLLREGRVLASGTPAALMSQTDTHDIEAVFLKLVGRP